MSLRGEQLIVVATPDPVEAGQKFSRIPLHMTVMGWFSFPEEHYDTLQQTLSEQFEHQPVFQRTAGGEADYFGDPQQVAERSIPVRKMLNVETEPWFALHALVERLGSFPEDTIYKDTYAPHVSDTPERRIKEGEHVAFKTVALFAKDPSQQPKVRQVLEAYQLRSLDD